MADKRKFRLGTTSFIFPDHILPNVKKLGRFFDEIELLVFESLPEYVLPSASDVQDLLYASKEFDLTYNIHLPTDITLCSDSAEERRQAAEIYRKVIERFSRLNPTSQTLHLEMPDDLKQGITQNPGRQSDGIKKWQNNAYEGLNTLLTCGVDPKAISLETLDYPFRLVQPLVKEFNLPVCIDLGHGIKYGYDIAEIYAAHSTIPVMHLHGVAFSENTIKDHTRLDAMPVAPLNTILNILRSYTGVVSLEVFNLENLNHSLTCLSRYFTGIPKPVKKE